MPKRKRRRTLGRSARASVDQLPADKFVLVQLEEACQAVRAALSLFKRRLPTLPLAAGDFLDALDRDILDRVWALSKKIDALQLAGRGTRLRTARIALGLTEEEAARSMGVSVRTWRAYEAGRESDRCGAADQRFIRLHRLFGWVEDGEDYLGSLKELHGAVTILPVCGPRERARFALRGTHQAQPQDVA